MLPKSLPLKLLVVFGIIAVGWFTFLNQWSGGGPGQLAAPASLDGSSFFDDYDNLTYVDPSSLNNVSWDGQSAISYSYSAGGGGGGGGEIDPASVLGSGLIGLWHFNGNANDSTAFGQNGALTGPAVACNAVGMFGTQACSFSGGYVSDEVRVSFDSTKPVFNIDNAEPFTVSAWIYPLGLNNYAGLVGRAWGTTWLLSSGDNSNSIGFYVDGTRLSTDPNSVALNTWTHVAATFDGATKRIYLNGTLAKTETVSNITMTDTSPLRIGGNGSGDEWNGKIDEVAIWNRTLSASEVNQLATASGGTPTPTGPGSFRSTNLNSGAITQLTATWIESAPGASVVSFSTNNGSTWCPISKGQTLTGSSCFGGSTLKYKVDFANTSNNFQSVTWTWQTSQPPPATSYTITATAGSGGTISPSGTISVNAGGSQTFTIAANSGYQIASVLVNGSSAGAVATYTFPNVQSIQTISASFSVITSPPPTGVTYYVAPTGNDANPGTLASPWRTLAKAGNTARAGDTIYIRAGTYNETLRPANSGTAGSLITFKAYPGDECKGTFAGTKGDCRVKMTLPVNLFGRNYVRLEGFEITNTTDGVNLPSTQGNQIVNNFIHDISGQGVYAKGESGPTTGLLVENNEIARTGQNAIWASNSQNTTIRGNNVHYIGCDGMVANGIDTWLVEYNHLYDSVHTDCHEDGFDSDKANNVVIRYNTIHDWTQLIYFDNDEGVAGYHTNIEIYGNVLYTTPSKYEDAPGISMGGPKDENISIHSNTCGYLGSVASHCIRIYSNNAKNIKIRNNIAYDAVFSIELGDMSQLSSNYNIFYGSRHGNPINPPSFDGPNSQRIDPQFVNYNRTSSWDFRLQATSPAIDKGALGPIPIPANFTDLWNNLRPQDGPDADTIAQFDIGAYEYPGGGTPGDTTPPAVSITAPANGATVSGSAVTVSANASDNVAVAGVQFKLDGANLGAEDTSAPYSVNWNTTSATNGSHTLTAVARDAAGNTTTAVAVGVTVSNVVSAKFIIGDRVITNVSGINVRFLPTVNSTILGTQTVGVLGTVVSGPVAADGYIWWSVNYDSGPDGWTAENYLDKYTPPTGGDTTPPLVVILSPIPGAIVSDTVVISASALDPTVSGQTTSGLAGVQFKVNGVNQGTEVTTAPWSVSWNTALVANGTYTLTAAARDNAGNTATSPNVTVTVSNVSQPPPDPGTCTYTINAGESINKYSSTVRAGETVCVRAGTYTETLRPANSGTAGNLITFKAFPGDECKGEFAGIKSDCRVVIDGQNIRSTGANTYPRNYIRIEGFEIRNHTGDAVYLKGYYDPAVEGIQIVNNYIHNNNGEAVTFRGQLTESLLIENNEIYANGLTAISGVGNNTIVRGNNIHYNGKDGIRGGGNGLLFEYNIMYDQFHTTQHQDALDLEWITNSVIRYNTISDFTQLIYGGLPVGEPLRHWENLEIYGNVFYNSRYWSVNGGESQAIFIDQRAVSSAQIKNISIHSNTFGWTGYGAIWLYAQSASQISGVKIYNNIFTDKGVSITGNGSGVLSNYNFYALASSKPSFEGPNSTSGQNPQLQNYTGRDSAVFDFRLKSTSPAIDTGSLGTIIPPSPFKDIDGITRPQDGPDADTIAQFDIGAYEYPGGGTPGDTTPPTVSLTSPANGATVFGPTVTVSANAADNVGVAGVQFKLDGANLGAEDTTSPYSTTWNTTSATNDAHTLTAVARDAAGNTTTAVAVGVTVSNVVSAKFIIGDRVITNVSGINVRFLPSLSGAILGTQSAGVLGTVVSGPVAADGYIWWSVNYDSGPDGWTAENYLDKYTPPTGGDTTPPLVVILSPAPNATVADTVVISASALDPTVSGQTTSGLAGVQFKVNGVNQGTEVTTAPWSVSWNTALVANGTYTLTAAARDNAGNTATSPNVTVTVSNVSQPPPTGNLYYVAPTGNDANPGTLASPWRTLAKAGNTARAGDTVYIRAGTYNETLRPFNSGTAGNLITFKAAPGEECQGAFAQPKTAGSCKVIIDGQNSRSAGIDLSRPNKYVKIEGFEIKNHIGDGGIFFQGWGATGVEGIEIVNNYVHSNKEEGIWAKNSWNSLFENNEIYNNGRGGVGGTAIEIGGQVGSKGAILRGNNIHFNEKDGIRGACQDCLIELNRIYDMFHTGKHQDGLDLAYSQINVTIRNNTIYDLTQLIYFPLKDESGWKIENVSIYGNVLYNERYWSVNGGESQCIFLDARVRPENTVKNVSIYANTCGWTGYQSLWIYGTGNNIDTVKVKNNIFNGMDFGAITNLDVSDNIDSRTIDPKFVAYSGKGSTSFNLHLQSSSPAIDKGANLASVVTLPSPFKDIDGTIRPQGTAYDIGAYEYASVGTTAICGNGVIESSEQCDGANLGGQTCTARGFTGGTLSCTSVCTFNTSQCTTATTDTTAPSVPFGFTATPVSSTQINLVWLAATDNVGVAGYKLYRNNGTVPIALVSATSYQDSSLNANTTYTYQVSAYDAAGNESAKSAGISATTLPAPDSTPPTISAVTATSIGTDRATITWTTDEPATSQVDYGFDTSYNQSTALQTALVTSHSQTLTGLTAHATYHYRVKSKDAGGLESTSVDFAFTTLPAPLADTTAPQTIADLRVSGTERKSAALAWTAPYQDLTSATSGPVASYDLRYSRDPITETNWDSSSVAQASGAPTPALPGAAETYTLVDLSPNKTYYAALRSTDAAVNLSALSNVVSFTTSAEPRGGGGGGGGGGGSSGGSIATADTTAPTSPTTVTIQAADRQAILRWQNPTTTDFVRMLVLRSFVPLPVITSPGNPRYLPMATVVADTNLPYFTDTNLTNGQLYYYTLYAYDRSGNWAKPVTMTATPSRTAGQTLDRQTFTPAQRASLLLELRRRLLELLIKLLTLLRGQQIQ